MLAHAGIPAFLRRDWLKVMKKDKRTFFQAASYGSHATRGFELTHS